MRIVVIIFFSLVFSDSIEKESTHQIGLFQKYKYNYSKEIQLDTYPIYFFAIPNLNLRFRHNNKISQYIYNNYKSKLFSNHSIVIPTMLLNMIKKEGMFGIVSPELNDFPFMIAFKNDIELILNRDLYDVKIRTGLTLGYTSQKLDKRSTIDLPIVFSRMQIYYNTCSYLFNFSLIFEIINLSVSYFKAFFHSKTASFFLLSIR